MHEVMHAHLVDFVCPVCIFRFAHLKNKLIIIIMKFWNIPIILCQYKLIERFFWSEICQWKNSQ